jgi:hypothetical protein
MESSKDMSSRSLPGCAPATPSAPDEPATSGMVERVARAIAWPVWRKCLPGQQPDDVIAQYVDMNWSEHIDQARAAIEAMREPTKAMIDAYVATDEAQYASDYDANVREVFAAMIDAALIPPEPSAQPLEAQPVER